jgi:two-component system LytT family sensor kinase
MIRPAGDYTDRMNTLSSRPLWVRLLYLVGVATVLAFFSAAPFYLFYVQEKSELSWIESLLWQLTWWCSWVPLAPSIMWLARRFPLDRQGWIKGLIVHLPMAILYVYLHLTIYFASSWLVGGDIWKMMAAENAQKGLIVTLGTLYKNPFMINFQLRLLVYAVILVVGHASEYYRQYQEEELRASDLKAKLAQAQLQALKMQLHPHFLFNTLNSISALLYKDIEAADRMIGRLIHLFELALKSSGAQKVTLQQELDFLNQYLAIENVRFQDRLSVQMEIDPQTLEAVVPNLIMQPIVENAIRHGIAPKSSAGRIEIHARRIDGNLEMQVKDNGPGFPGNGSAAGVIREGLGLANTRARLQHLYGSNHNFTLTNDPNGGLVVTVAIPFESNNPRRFQRI